MNKENNRSAAGLRRSAMVERIRLREEWSALKGSENTANNKQNVLNKIRANVSKNIILHYKKNSCWQSDGTDKNKVSRAKRTQEACNVLKGVVALVEVGSETKALPLRAALTALGASVVPAWSPLVTHLVWSEGGSRATRAKGRALACHVVSPLWVEACAAGPAPPERAFPAARRASDLPSPRTLRQNLKKAEAENMPLFELLNDSKEEPRPTRLRISSETEPDTTASTDTSRDTSHDKSRDKSTDTTGVESRVNTAPRRALPMTSVSPCVKPTKSRRKLFTHKEGELHGSEEDEDEAQKKSYTQQSRPTQRERRDLACAERMARALLSGRTTTPHNTRRGLRPRIVLTGMAPCERQRISQAVQSLGGKIQALVTRRTTHVLLGSCSHQDGDRALDRDGNVCSNITGTTTVHRSDVIKPRTLNALAGAARGCRVLTAQWTLDSLEANKWLHHYGYEVPHLKKISQKARVERIALGKLHSEYAYDVFSGMRVNVSPTTQQKDAAIQLLTLCGAIVQDGGGVTADFDITLGTGDGEINSKWVFDSVAASRMRTTRRYKNNYIPNTGNVTTQMSDR